jgi:hypothetical protein
MPRAFDPSKTTMARQGHHAAKSTVNNMCSSVTKAQPHSTDKLPVKISEAAPNNRPGQHSVKWGKARYAAMIF